MSKTHSSTSLTSLTLTKEETKHIADLVNLTLTEDELELYAKQLTDTLEYIKNLNQLDTNSVQPTFQTSGNINRFLDETKGERTLTSKQALENASLKKNDFFQISGLNYQK